MINEVKRISEDQLTQEVWRFVPASSRSLGLIMNKYRIETRKTTRHKFRTSMKWSSMDERRYYSQLDRPEAIPSDVLEEALSKLEVNIYIGWSVNEHLHSTHEVGEVR